MSEFLIPVGLHEITCHVIHVSVHIQCPRERDHSLLKRAGELQRRLKTATHGSSMGKVIQLINLQKLKVKMYFTSRSPRISLPLDLLVRVNSLSWTEVVRWDSVTAMNQLGSYEGWLRCGGGEADHDISSRYICACLYLGALASLHPISV